MAKPPETRDRFRLVAEIDAEAMGPLLAQLTRMGLQNISYELITDVHTFARRNRTVHESSAEEFASAWIAEHPTFKVVDLTVHFAQNGRSPSTGHYIARKLARDGKLTELGDGNYRRADVREIAPPQMKQARRDAGKPARRFEITGEESIWRHVKNRQKFTLKDLRTLFRAQGRNEASASPILTELAKQKKVRKIDNGIYAVIKKAVPAKKGGKNQKAKQQPANASAITETSDA